jgi:hypothetical protein
MTTRRGFLISTLALASTPVVARGATLGTAPVVRIITEAICADTRNFARHFGIHSGNGEDSAECLFELERELIDNKLDRIFGLTRASTQFLVQQTAASYGYQTTYQGQHQYESEQLTHSLEGSRASIDIAAKRLTHHDGAWAAELADAMSVLGDSDALSEQRVFTLASDIPNDSSRHLVSWMLRSVS